MLLKSPSKPITMVEILRSLNDIARQKQEHFVVLTLNSKGQLINKRLVFLGTVSSTICHPREIFAGALTDMASSIVISHNHPSGDPWPSEQDIAATEQLVAASQILGIEVHDHVIVAGDRHFSFCDHNMLLHLHAS